MRGEIIGQAGGVFGGLSLDARESALRLGLDRAQGLAVKVKQVIGVAETWLHGELPYGDAAAGGEVEFVTALDDPTGGGQVGVYEASSLLFRGFRHLAAGMPVVKLCSGMGAVGDGGPKGTPWPPT